MSTKLDSILRKVYLSLGIRERILWLIGFSFAIISSIIGLFLPSQINYIFQNLSDVNFSNLVFSIVVFSFQTILMYISLYILGTVGEKYIFSLRQDGISTLLQCDNFELEGTVWASRVMYDSGNLTDLVSRIVPRLLINTIQLVFILCLLFYVNTKLTFIIILGILCLILVSLILGRLSSRIHIKFQDSLSQTTQQLSDAINRLKLIKINLTGIKEVKEAGRSLRELYIISKDTLKYSIINQMILQLFFVMVVCVVIFTIIRDINSMVINWSDVSLYLMYCIQLSVPLLSLSDEFTNMGKTMEILRDYIDKMSSLNVSSASKIEVESGNHNSIEIFNLSNPYNENKINRLTFNGHEVYQLFGRSGIGKTTLLNSVLGLVGYDIGKIKITLKKSAPFYQQVAYYQSEKQLIVNKTIRENLNYAQNISDVELIKTLEAFGFLEELHYKNILDCVINEESLSKGQIARISLAREYLKKDASIVILDEPFAHLDRINSEKIDSMFRERFKESILIFVSHTKDYYSPEDNMVELV